MESKGAWIFQRSEQVDQLGEDKAPWYVGWYDPSGKRRKKSCGAGHLGKKAAQRLANKLTGELLSDTYDMTDRKKEWSAFRSEYEEVKLSALAVRTQTVVKVTLDYFEQMTGPKRVTGITTADIDRFKVELRKLEGRKPGEEISARTVNKHLRHIKAVLSFAVKRKYLKEMPVIDMEPVGQSLKPYVTEAHFKLIYEACEHATKPRDIPHVSACDWWRALLTFAYLTGWRIGEILALKREDLDFDNGYAITRGEDNKANRDEMAPVHPIALDHLKRIETFDPFAFPWNHHNRTLHAELYAIQRKAGINLTCRKKHGHTGTCHLYSFHDFRRAFATLNALHMTAEALQRWMRHKSYLTTQKYIRMAEEIHRTATDVHVPGFLREPIEDSQRNA